MYQASNCKSVKPVDIMCNTAIANFSILHFDQLTTTVVTDDAVDVLRHNL